jgi:hypothetical protein
VQVNKQTGKERKLKRRMTLREEFKVVEEKK